MPYFKRHFSLDEAQILLPELRERFARMQGLVAQIREEQAKGETQQLTIMRGNGSGPILQGLSPRMAELQELLDEVVKMGIQIKDLERGLIDFPHFLDGDAENEVLLCYEMSELKIGYWHEIDTGYMSRKPL